MKSALAVVVTFYGLFMAASPALQIRLMLRRRSSEGVSLGYFGVLLGGFVLWFAYGLAHGDVPILITNAVAGAMALLAIAVGLRFRRAGGGRPGDGDA